MLPEVRVRCDFGGLPVYDASFVDGERSTGLQQSIEAIQDGGTNKNTWSCNELNMLIYFALSTAHLK